MSAMVRYWSGVDIDDDEREYLGAWKGKPTGYRGEGASQRGIAHWGDLPKGRQWPTQDASTVPASRGVVSDTWSPKRRTHASSCIGAPSNPMFVK